MFILFYVCILVSLIHGHETKVQSESELQSGLMPQELNPAFVSDKGGLWSSVFPLPRSRREADLIPMEAASPSVGQNVKRYSRIVAFVTLIVSAVTEIVLHFIDVFYNT